METTYLLARSIIKPWIGSWFRWSLEGAEKIPVAGPALIAFNHISFLDPLAAAYVVDKAGRVPRFLAKQELFDDKRIAWILRGARQIPVHRGTKDAPMALDAAFEELARGELIVIFPEGTITTDPDLNPMEGKSGLARLALEADVPVVPCALWGTGNIWPKGYAKNWRPRQDICARVGEPMSFSGESNPENWRRVTSDVMAAISLLVASLRPAVPDHRRPKRRAA